jgi:tetratricopeptide (TPR) repeat protein
MQTSDKLDAGLKELLLGRGVESGTAAAVAEAYEDWPAVAAATNEALTAKFGVAGAEQLASAKSRREIPVTTVRRLMEDCSWSCCYCWDLDRRIGVLIHHIDEHAVSLNDSYENLVVLCPNCHSEAHRKYTIARHPYSPDSLRMQKSRFTEAVSEFRAGRRPAPGREPTRPNGRGVATAPLPPKHFTGRTQSLEDIRVALLQGTCRVALVGMGGVGKTALALKAVDLLKLDFPGGVFWVVSDGRTSGSRRAIHSVIVALGEDDSDLDDGERAVFAQTLLARRADKHGRLLLVIDSAAEGDLEGLLGMVSGLPLTVALLVTTREASVALALDAHALALAPLPRADAGGMLSVHSDSRAGLGVPGAERLLELLGDLPLAIELVARQIALFAEKPGFTILGLCDRLQRFDEALLSFPGHRGIARSFALSYDSMDVDERRLFRSLGVFAEGLFSLDAVSAVSVTPERTAGILLDRFVGISVLHWDTAPGRYRAHTLIHKYAGFLLGRDDGAERTAAETRHSEHFITAANSIATRRPPDLPAMDRLLADYTKAMHSAAHAGEAARVAESMAIVWKGADYFATRSLESQALLLLELAAACAEKTGQPDLLAELLAHRGRALLRLCKVREGIKVYERAIMLTRDTGNLWDLSSNLQNLGQALVTEGKNLPRAERELREALRHSETARNAEAATATLTSLGGLYRHLGRMSEAAEMYGRGLRMARLFGNQFGEGNNRSNLGLIQLDTGQLVEAEKSIRGALAIALEIRDRRGEGNRTGHLGRIMLERAKNLTPGPERDAIYEEAIKAFQIATEIALETNDPEKASVWLMNLGVTYVSRDQHGTARQMFSAALAQAAKLDSLMHEGQIRLNLGTSLMLTGELKQAAAELERSRDLFRGARSPLAAHAEKNLALIAAYFAKHGGTGGS